MVESALSSTDVVSQRCCHCIARGQPMFDEVPGPLSIHDPLTSQISDLWNSGKQDLRLIATECDVRISTVHRKLRDCDLS